MQKINTLLREARESRQLSIKDAAKALNLRERHIRMLEEGQLAELSREIYLKGFLKTYTSWLNVDGGEILSQINHEKKKINIQQSAPIIPLDLSLLAGLVRRPGFNIFFLSSILTVIIYIFWYSSHKDISGIDMVKALELDEKLVISEYSNVLKEYHGRDIVLFPRANVELIITNTGTAEEKLTKLVEGDIIFIKIEENTLITTNSANSIEVFLDNNGQQEPLGTLDKILISF